MDSWADQKSARVIWNTYCQRHEQWLNIKFSWRYSKNMCNLRIQDGFTLLIASEAALDALHDCFCWIRNAQFHLQTICIAHLRCMDLFACLYWMSTAVANTHTYSGSGRPLWDQCLCKSEKMRVLFHSRLIHLWCACSCGVVWCPGWREIDGCGVLLAYTPWWTPSTLQQSFQLSTASEWISEWQS